MTEPIVFACDPYLWEFLRGNVVTLGLILAILKSLAVAIPSVSDNKIFKLFQVVLAGLIGLRKPKATTSGKPLHP